MKKQLIVIAKNQENITLANQDSGCSSCGSKGSCGVGVLAKLSNKTITQKYNGENIGDIVEIEINNYEFIKNSAMLYMLPIFALFGGALLSQKLFANNDLLQFIITILFFSTAIWLLSKSKISSKK